MPAVSWFVCVAQSFQGEVRRRFQFFLAWHVRISSPASAICAGWGLVLTRLCNSLGFGRYSTELVLVMFQQGRHFLKGL
jgi:hypothetical protein